jgi:molybdopterin converting factor small subunit
MQEISPNRFAGIIETNDALINGVRGFVRSLVLRQAQHERAFNLFNTGLSKFIGRMSKTLFLSPTDSLVSRHEVEIMYFGRTSEFLMMTSERMVIPTGRYTLGQLLSSLYKRGDRWVDELDDSHLLCTVNGRDARLFDPIAPGAEICISSKKSIFEG